MSQSEARNITMVMDLYELTMAYGYFRDGAPEKAPVAVFDVFFRRHPDEGGFSIFAGLEQIVDYVENIHFSTEDIDYLRSLKLFDEDFLTYLSTYRFHGDIKAFPEGTIMYPEEPVLTVTAPIIDAQIVETAILTEINHQSLIATKTSRIVRAAAGRSVFDFGARRAHNVDAAVYGARAAYIGGADGTATLLAGQLFDIPVTGTMAHSWVMYYGDEFTAFRRYAETYPDNVVLLVDTYDVMHSGIPNAIRTAKEVLAPMGKRLKGVRLDSGDLAYLSKRVRKALDEAELEDCRIIASNSLDEYTISSILGAQGGKLDGFGVGERLITSKSEPVFGAVYKLAEIEKDGVRTPKIKVSETVEKITNPGRKKVYRVYDGKGKAIADLLTLADEKPDFTKPYLYVDPKKPWKKHCFTDCTAKELQVDVIRDGKRVAQPPSLKDVRDYVRRQLEEEIWEEEQRFENPHTHYLDMSPAYYHSKMKLLGEVQQR
ncbi:nicotinate phosphoribosyltransferase [Selenomonas sp. TAMA-11512]|uniref:nicotinate phosphoribosyltransferase n=1 Tax=Selenomonas sp. TAMA-11512 TaxID=3095337 RepID=UPI00308D6BF8|nr:nicotinate phosphoribosyltransferase [Selenomonas sp. TAMA-11512]